MFLRPYCLDIFIFSLEKLMLCVVKSKRLLRLLIFLMPGMTGSCNDVRIANILHDFGDIKIMDYLFHGIHSAVCCSYLRFVTCAS